MKNLYPAMFAIAVDKAAMIFDMVEFASDGGCRSWNLRFCCAFQDWDIGIFDDFFAHISSKLPRGAKYGCEGEVGALFPLLALMV